MASAGTDRRLTTAEERMIRKRLKNLGYFE
jgi:hypothetical protein